MDTTKNNFIKKASYHTSCIVNGPTDQFIISIPRIDSMMKIHTSAIKGDPTKTISYIIDKVLDLVSYKLENSESEDNK